MMTFTYPETVRVNTVRRYVIGEDPKECISDAYVPGKVQYCDHNRVVLKEM